MHQDTTTSSHGEPHRADHRTACVGCDALTGQSGYATIRLPKGYAFVCLGCAGRAASSPKLKRQIEMAALSGFPLSELQRIYTQLGCDVPTTPAEFDAAMRLPPGTSAAIFGGA